MLYAALIDEHKRRISANFVLHFSKCVCEVQRFKSRMPQQRFLRTQFLQIVDLRSILIVEKNSAVMAAFFEFSAVRQQFVDQDKRTSRFAGGVFSRPAKEIEELQRLATEIFSMKKNLKPTRT
jgi:hypothetical protein